MPRLFLISCLQIVLSLILPVSTALGTPAPRNQIVALSHDPQWLALLHMRQHFVTGRYDSEVAARDFFLSGKTNDSAAELAATLSALQSTLTNDDSAWCRFPARAQFLKQHFSLREPDNLHCNALNYWRSRFNADEIVMVYPDPYLKNIASIFGHTFLRIDAKDKTKNPILLSQTVSYYADVGTAGNSAALYIAKGLTGHFPGIIELAPYFEKLRKYSDSEDRDIREYRLEFSPQQVRSFVDHVWEVRDNSFNYFFLDENCSYRLISMLDTITPTHRLRENFSSHTIPVDTIKVLQDNHLISSYRYIPSARKRFYEQREKLTAAQKKQLDASIRYPLSKDIASSNIHADGAVLALAENYNGMQIQADPEKRTQHNMQVSHLVQQQYETGLVMPDAPSQLQAPDPSVEGHDMMRWQTGWLHDGGEDYAVIGARFAYHDLHDPLSAYQKGVQLEVLDTQLRVSARDAGKISIDSIRWFNLQSYSPVDHFFQDASWGFSVIRQRELVGDGIHLANIAEGYRGLTLPCGALLCHAELRGGVLTGGALNNGWDMRAGASAGLLYQGQTWSWSTDIAQQYYLANHNDTLFTINTEAGYRISQNWSAYAAYRYQKNDETQRDRFQISLRHFF